jgi:hypothetical protein
MVAEQVYDYRFPGLDMPIVSLRVRVSELAQRNGFMVVSWIEDGLGQACGMFVKLRSGRVVFVLELRHLIEHHRALGPTVYIDAAEIAKFGIEPLVSEVLKGLVLSQQDIDWVAPAENQMAALDVVRRTAANKEARK